MESNPRLSLAGGCSIWKGEGREFIQKPFTQVPITESYRTNIITFRKTKNVTKPMDL